MVLLATQSLKISEKEITTSTIHMLRGFVSRYFLLSDDCWITLELTMFMLHRLWFSNHSILGNVILRFIVLLRFIVPGHSNMLHRCVCKWQVLNIIYFMWEDFCLDSYSSASHIPPPYLLWEDFFLGSLISIKHRNANIKFCIVNLQVNLHNTYILCWVYLYEHKQPSSCATFFLCRSGYVLYHSTEPCII
jgi:hypothetical protein